MIKHNFIFFILVSQLTLSAQFSTGIYGGINHGAFKGEGVSDAVSNGFTHTSTSNFCFGIRSIMPLHLETNGFDFKGIGFEAGVSQRAGEFKIEQQENGINLGNESSFKYTYIDIGLDHLITFQIAKKFSLNLINGIYFSPAITGKFRSNWYAENLPSGLELEDILNNIGEKKETERNLLDANKDERKSFDLGLRSGIGVSLGKISLRALYHLGLTDITGRHREQFYNRFWSFNVSYAFRRSY